MMSGELLLWIGIAGMAAVIVISAVVIAVLYNSRKKLRKKLDCEYYDKQND